MLNMKSKARFVLISGGCCSGWAVTTWSDWSAGELSARVCVSHHRLQLHTAQEVQHVWLWSSSGIIQVVGFFLYIAYEIILTLYLYKQLSWWYIVVFVLVISWLKCNFRYVEFLLYNNFAQEICEEFGFVQIPAALADRIEREVLDQMMCGDPVQVFKITQLFWLAGHILDFTCTLDIRQDW